MLFANDVMHVFLILEINLILCNMIHEYVINIHARGSFIHLEKFIHHSAEDCGSNSSRRFHDKFHFNLLFIIFNCISICGVSLYGF